ncbi:MAG: carbohydrate ABC transporter permease [Chloroflexota bacterium]
MNRHRARTRLTTGVAYGIALVATFVSLFPLYWLFVISTKTPREAFETPPNLIYIPDFSKYFEIWGGGFGESFLNSALVVLLGVALTLFAATPAAYAIVRFRIRGGRYVRFWLLLAYTTPEFLFVIPMYVAFQQLGLYDTVLGLAIIYQVFAIPFAIWLIESFLREVPRELGDSARIDGCSELQALVKVYRPLAAPGLAATSILVGINMWNEVTIALSLTFDDARTVQIAVAGYRGYAAIRWQEMAAAAVTAVLPMIIFASIAQRYIVKGLTFGAVK